MGIFKLTKFKIAVLVVALSMILGVLTGMTIAFFTDQRASTGIFTLGNVYIEMTEAAVKSDGSGNLVEDTDADRIQAADVTEGGLPNVHDYGVVFPGQSIHKDPTVKNTGDSDAWVAVKVVIEDGSGDIHKLYKYNDYYDDIDIERLLGGGLLDEVVHVGDWKGNEYVCYNSNYAMVQIPSRQNGVYEFYFILLNKMAPGESVEIFDKFFIEGSFDNNEMLEFKNFKITVRAYAVQTSGFDSCFKAMTVAFPDHFSAIDNENN